MNKITLLASFCFFLFITSCKKNSSADLASNITETPVSQPPSTGTSATTAQLNQVAFQKTQNYYIWASQLPANLDYASFADPAAIMTNIRQYSTEPGFNGPVDRWSFAMKKTEWDQISGGMSAATVSTAGDMGITVFFRAEGDLRVRLTEPNSPAGLLGVRRGWKITKINGNTNITTGNAQFIIDNVYNSNTASFTFAKPDGSSVDLTLNAGHYTKKPLYMDSVYTTPSGKAGYFVYNSFLGDMNQSAAEYARVFNKFSAEGITNLIVDLRYNGGGYVDLQEKLANYIINSSANGGMMMQQIYNTAHSAENRTSNYQKLGNVNLSKVYFIVSKSTASASELLINNLKPYMDVRLIGTSNTHGKPVGFFPIEDGEWYVFPVSFKTVNKNGEGNYYNGFAPNAIVADGLDKDWGDINESSLQSALRNISNGNYRGGSQNEYYESPAVSAGNTALDDVMLKVTIGSKRQ
jgi:carboxyl-terminal processing protease